MLTVNISNLKNQLSAYLQKVKKGEEILVMDRNQAVAKISRISHLDIQNDEEAHLAELERRGVLKRAKKKLPKDWFEKHPPVPCRASVVEALLQEREESDR